MNHFQVARRRAGPWLAAAAVGLSLALGGCVATRVSTSTSQHANVALERLLIVYRPGSFGASSGTTSVAGSLGNRNLGELVPHLYARLPLAFETQGVKARMVSEADLRTVRVQPGERILWVQPDSARYSSRGGQGLSLVADLVEPATRETLWHGAIHMATLGFGAFDASVADSIGSQLVEQMRSGGVIVTPGAAAHAAAPAPAPAASALPAIPQPASSPAPIASGFAALADTDAIPYLNDRGREGYRDWLRKPMPRAFALAADGHWYSTWGLKAPDPALPTDPSERALLMCERAAHQACKLYAVNGAVVWKPKESP